MEKEKGKTKQFVVTQSLRFPNPAMKILYYAGLGMMAAAVAAVGICLVTGTRGTPMGVAVIAGIFGIIWVLATRLVSENTYGLARITFGDEFIQFISGDDKFRLKWEDVVECGIEKTRRAYWVYASDHKVTDVEKKEFPENVDEGVFYFNYYWNTWEEFMKFVPENFKAELEKKKAEFKISD